MSTEAEIGKAVQPSIRRVRIEEGNGDLELSCHKSEGSSGCLLLLWLCGWTAGCTMLIRQIFLNPTFFSILVAIPFLISWVFAFALLIWMFFGVERVRLNSEGLEYRLTALVTLSRRLVPRTELKNVRAGVHGGYAKRSEQPCLKFETLGQPIEFACGLSAEEQRWLVEWLNEYLDAHGPHGPPQRNSVGGESITTDRRGVLQPALMPVEPPSDTRIEWRHHLDRIEFVWRGRWSLPAIAGTTCINLFWNGIISIFLYKQFEGLSWILFLFMIPHQLIGLCIFAKWLTALTAPLWGLTWTFSEREITRRLRVSDTDAIVFSFGWGKRFDMRPPIRVELRRREEANSSGSLWTLLSHPDGEYTLSFLDQGDKELLAINRLTEGDARWIADVLLRAFPSWYPNERPISIG